jgi:hypothetical protein
MPIILALGRQEDHKFEATMGYIVKPCLKKKDNILRLLKLSRARVVHSVYKHYLKSLSFVVLAILYHSFIKETVKCGIQILVV